MDGKTTFGLRSAWLRLFKDILALSILSKVSEIASDGPFNDRSNKNKSVTKLKYSSGRNTLFPKLLSTHSRQEHTLFLSMRQVSWKRQLGAKLSHREVKRL